MSPNGGPKKEAGIQHKLLFHCYLKELIILFPYLWNCFIHYLY